MEKCERSSYLNRNLVERVAIGDMLRRRARDCAEREALVEYVGGRRVALTYRDLNQRVNKLVSGFRSEGLDQGDKLALFSSNRIDYFTVAFACYKAGIVLIPINYLQSIQDIRYNLEHANAKAVVYEPVWEEVVLTSSDGLHHVELRVALGEGASFAHTSVERLLGCSDDSEIEDVLIKDRDVAQLLYTSGTTSRPKGVETSHLSLYFSSLSTPISLGLGRHHRHLVVLPLFHCAAQSICLSVLQVGGTLVLQQKFDPKQTCDLLVTERIQGVGLLPVMWHSLLQYPGITDVNFPDLKLGIYAMAPMNVDTLRKLRDIFGCVFHLASGQSEFTPAACVFYDGSESEFGEGNYWGVPAIAVDQAILDEQGNEVPDGIEGEICWRGPQVMSGYLNNAEATEDVSKFGWHHSGDLGLIDSKGQLLFIDRKKDIVKTGGENVSSCQVEQVLLGIDGVLQAGVFGVPHPRWSEALCACITVSPGSELNEATIIDLCKVQLGGFQVPKRILIVEELPLTSTGKVLKRDLRELYKNLFS